MRLESARGKAHPGQVSRRSTLDANAVAADRLALDRAATARRTELRLPDHLSLPAWRRLGEQITVISDASAWWLGDWIVYGQDRFPDRYKRALAETSLAYQTLRNYAWVARRIAAPRRREQLSFQHHAEVVALPESDQEVWLDRAVAFGWPVSVLRKQLKATRANSGRRATSDPEVVKIRADAERVRCWQAAANAERRELQDWIMFTIDRAAGDVLEMGLPGPRGDEP